MRLAAAPIVLVALLACSRRPSDPTPNRVPQAPSAWSTPPSAPTPTMSGPARPIPNAPGTGLPPSAVAEKAAGPPRAGCIGLFDPPEGAVKLCDEHTLAAGSETHWTSWAVAASRMDTFRPYRERAEACGASATTKPPLLSLSKEGVRLSVHDAMETGYPSCAGAPPPGQASVIVISVKVDHR